MNVVLEKKLEIRSENGQYAGYYNGVLLVSCGLLELVIHELVNTLALNSKGPELVRARLFAQDWILIETRRPDQDNWTTQKEYRANQLTTAIQDCDTWY